MDSTTIDFTCGIFKCCAGIAMISAGAIGWPATRAIFHRSARFFAHTLDRCATAAWRISAKLSEDTRAHRLRNNAS